MVAVSELFTKTESAKVALLYLSLKKELFMQKLILATIVE